MKVGELFAKVLIDITSILQKRDEEREAFERTVLREIGDIKQMCQATQAMVQELTKYAGKHEHEIKQLRDDYEQRLHAQ